jgi:hypothetical protein
VHQRFPRPILWSSLGRGNRNQPGRWAPVLDQPDGATVGAV